MGEVKQAEIGVPSVSAFVEGGIQDSCDDGCSICLEDFSDSNPSTVTDCKHEFHLHCILEWCQRSSNCPMCWQSLSLKDPSSQELFVAVEKERSVRSIPSSHDATIFHHHVHGDFEIQHLAGRMIDAELEERTMQHLAAAAAMRRSSHRSTRRDLRIARPQFVVLSESTDASSASTEDADESPLPVSSSTQGDRISFPESPATASTSRGMINDNSYSSESASRNSDGAGPSETRSLSDAWRSRLSSVSMRYKESISQSAVGWREKLFSRSSSMADIGSEVRREINAGIARMMGRLDTRSNDGEHSRGDSSVDRDNRDTHSETPSTSAG